MIKMPVASVPSKPRERGSFSWFNNTWWWEVVACDAQILKLRLSRFPPRFLPGFPPSPSSMIETPP